MDIKIETCYGNVTLQYCYDCDEMRAEYYEAFDDNGDCLGELWNVPYYDEDDEDCNIEDIVSFIEDAIDSCDIAMPMSIHKTVSVVLVTVLETRGGFSFAYSNVFSNRDNAIEYKLNALRAFDESLSEEGVLRDIVDAGDVCEIKTANQQQNYICITIKECDVI